MLDNFAVLGLANRLQRQGRVGALMFQATRWLFAVKLVTAAMIAFAISVRIGLPQTYLTVVSLLLAGLFGSVPLLVVIGAGLVGALAFTLPISIARRAATDPAVRADADDRAGRQRKSVPVYGLTPCQGSVGCALMPGKVERP